MIPFHIVLRPHDPHLPIIDRIAQGRNIDPDNFRESLSLRKTRGDPLLLNDIQKGVDRIIQAYTTNERITIFADYDVDGVSSATLLSLLFSEIIPYPHVHVMFPDRLEDGYGIKTKHLDQIKTWGSTVVITVDNGITSLIEADHARSLGIDLIITDHHEPLSRLPNAYAVINPRCSTTYPHRDICGCAVVYKLACVLIDQLVPANERSRRKTYLLPLVTLATVADIVPLHGENRALVAQGLSLMRQSEHLPPWLKAFLDFLGIRKTVDTYHLWFMIGPRINAGGRIASPYDSLNALINRDNKAHHFLHTLDVLNTERKAMQQKAYDLARTMVDPTRDMVMVFHESFHEGIVGIVAGKLCEQWYKLTMVGKIDTHKWLMTASLRSPDYANCIEFLDFVSDLTVKSGGHHHAGGLSVSLDNLDAFLERCKTYEHKYLHNRPRSKPLIVDTHLHPDERDQTLLATLDQFAPYGEANPQPILLLTGKIVSYREYQRDEKIMRFFSILTDTVRIPVVVRRCERWDWQEGETISIVWTIGKNREWLIQYIASAIFSSDGKQCMCE